MRWIAPAALLITLGLISCDRRPATAPVTTAPNPPTLELELKPITPLLPERPTHVAVDTLGNIYWVQEGDRADDTMFVIGQGDIPRVTQLSAGAISAALNAPGGKGNIHDIAAGPGGDIYFYFNGVGDGRRTLACVGIYTPKSAQVRILADTDALAEATGMGRSLPLARGSIVADPRNVWIWIRHSDAWAMFRIDPRSVATSGAMRLPRAFDAVTLSGQPIALTREEYQIAPAPNGSLFLVDPLAGRLLKIAPSGQATVARSLVGLPVDLSTPTVDSTGRLLIFAANDKLIPRPAGATPTTDPSPPEKFDATFPALLIFDTPAGGNGVMHIGRDNMQAYPGFPVFGMRLRELVPQADAQGWVTYDAGSGELLRAIVHEKAYP
jgi:hypothetical protein